MKQKNMRSLFVSLVLCSIATMGVAQEIMDSSKVATVKIDTNVLLLDQWKTDRDKAIQKMDGFIILIGSESGANSKTRAYNKQQAFNAIFPEIETKLVWKNPNYQVTAGTFRTRLEAEKAIKQIQTKYPAALIMPAKIDFIPTH